MNIHPDPLVNESPTPPRAQALLEENHQQVWRRTDRMFVWLMLFEWLVGIAFALWLSPLSWKGAQSEVHPHVWTAIFLGGVINLWPMLMVRYQPGRPLTRHVVAIGQMLMSSLLIHLQHGRIEAHFQIFGSLAFLAFYRDWRILVTATVVVAADHFLRGAFFPESIFGVTAANSWRWIEHAAYVVFEVFFLLLAMKSSLEDSANDANRKAALEALKEGVEGQVATRTAQLTAEIGERKRVEEELATARDAALEAARSKAQFLANMSHEIRTPMNGVMGMAGLLLDTPLDREQREFAETIRQSGDLLLSIINDILDFSKIEAGKLHFETLDFDLREVMEGSLEMIAEKAQAQGLELLGNLPPEIFTARRGDAGRLRQILTNLLNNAVKFTERGEVVLRVSELSDHLLRFEVRDTGIGIDSEVQKRLFQPFVQADGSTTRKYGGSGLGLVISRQLVEMMNGEIGVESTPGRGSTFWFTAQLERQDITRRPPDHDNLAGLHVLIVDDNATNRHILHLQLSSLRMRCAAADSGTEALRILRREAGAGTPFDLAIIDMQMPEMDGLMLAKEIKDDARIAETRLVMLSSLGRHLDTSGFKAMGIEEYLVKPVKQSRLYDCMAEVMEQTNEEILPAAMVPTEIPAAPPQSERILLAEDNIINQKVALRQLAKLGYTADAVANGLEVLEALERIPYDIILMDCQMPDLDGYDTTRQIRQRESRHVHIIAMTAHAMQGDREKCIAAGMDDYVTKPVKVEHLHVALQRSRENRAVDTAVVDLVQLRDASDQDPAEMQSLALTYLEQANEIMPELGAALKANSAYDVNRLAHKLAGSSASCGMIAMVPVLRELEQIGQNGDLSSAAPSYARATQALEKTRQFLTQSLLAADGAPSESHHSPALS